MAAKNIVSAHVVIRGTRPLLFHKFGPDALPLEPGEKIGVPGHNPEEWRRTVMVTKEGQLYMMPEYVFASAREGAKYTKKGRGSIMKDVAATLQVNTERIFVDRYFPNYPNGKTFNVETVKVPPEDPELPVYIDIRGVRNPSTKARNVRYRVACSKGWSCEFDLLFDKTIVATAQMNAVMIDAGRLSGIGNGRAIGFGRFDVVSFDLN